ncbi:MAG: cytochrome c oxidase assembly protein [Pseudomonadota bacterium]
MEQDVNEDQGKAPVKRLVPKLWLVVIGMFAFGFLLVPIYDVFCEITGLNGKTNETAYKAVDLQVDKTRMIDVLFVATNNDGMVWTFKPEVRKVSVHPGEPTDVTFFANNPSNKRMVSQAIPSVAPNRAAAYFHKTECFCFEKQALEANESIDMPLRFVVDPGLPKDITSITLSYTLFDVTDKFGNDDEKTVNELLQKTQQKFKKDGPVPN